MISCRSVLLALITVAALAATSFAGQFQVREIKVGEKRITVMIFRGQSYRKIEVGDLSDMRLAGQLVCLEGKLKSAGAKGARLFGTDRVFKYSSPELFRKLVPGDNVWVGGRVSRKGTKLEFLISVTVKLKTDLELFEERFKAAGAAGDWKRLLELASWIAKSKDYNPKIAFDEHRRYRTCKARAISKACVSAERAFKDEDAVGYTRLAAELLHLGASRETAYGYLRRAAKIDPDQESAAKRLAAAGFLKWHGQWVTREAKKELEIAEQKRLRQKLLSARAREARRGDAAVLGGKNHARDVIEMELTLASIKADESSARLASEIERASGPRLGRRALALAAALPVKMQAKPVAAALRSSEPQIRIAALELVACRKDLAARKALVQLAAADSSAEVTEIACAQLAKAGDVQALATLIGMVRVVKGKEFRSRAAVDSLRKATGQDRYTEAEWGIWWTTNKSSYPPGPSK